MNETRALNGFGGGEHRRQALEIEQTIGDADETVSDVDQPAADRESPVEREDPAANIKDHERDHTRLQRAQTTAERTQIAAARTATAQERFEVAEQRDDAARSRDLASEARDLKAEARDGRAALFDTEPGSATREHAAQDREHSADDRQHAAGDRWETRLDRDHMRDAVAEAHIDDLTGTLRRSLGDAALRGEVERSERSGQPLVLVFIDVDALETLNEQEGRLAGDEALLELVRSLRLHLRSYDPLVRFGGDKFVCAMPDTDLPRAHERIAAIQTALAKQPHGASISVGLTQLEPGDTLETIIVRGDAALYTAKHGHAG